MTEWMMEDEESLVDLRDAYREARTAIDARVPRGRRQERWIARHGLTWIMNQWAPAHFFLNALNRELDDDR